jgi:ribose 5-phosphate isomerase A
MFARMSNDDLDKKTAGEYAAKFVQSGMRVGLGTGSTADFFIRAVGAKVAAGAKVVCVPTSSMSAMLATELGIALDTLAGGDLDVTVDGADEIDEDGNLTKGGGAALLREKIVASATKHYVIVAHKSKQVRKLGAFPTPIEVIAFAEQSLLRKLAAMGAQAAIRKNKAGEVVVTDEGHHIIDARFGVIEHPVQLAQTLSAMAGVVEHGLFVGFHPTIVISDGGVVSEKKA